MAIISPSDALCAEVTGATCRLSVGSLLAGGSHLRRVPDPTPDPRPSAADLDRLERCLAGDNTHRELLTTLGLLQVAPLTVAATPTPRGREALAAREAARRSPGVPCDPDAGF